MNVRWSFMLICMHIGMACTAQDPLSQEDSFITAVEADGGVDEESTDERISAEPSLGRGTDVDLSIDAGNEVDTAAVEDIMLSDSFSDTQSEFLDAAEISTDVGDVDDGSEADSIIESDVDPWENVSFAGECPGDPTCANTLFKDVSAGMFHSCAVTEQGVVLCWGQNKDGQASPPDGGFMRVWAGWEQTCGLRVDGHVSCWGFDSQGQSSPPEEEIFTHVSIGRSHVCGVREDQTLMCWGEDHQGMASPPPGKYTEAAVGRYYSCALSVSGEAVCFGDDSQGTLSGIQPGPFKQLISGRWHVCGLDMEGEVTCWGSNEFGQLEAPEGPFEQLDGGWTHTCGLRGSEAPVCWGEGHQGTSPPPDEPGEWTWVSAGDGHNCGLRDKKVVCWGDELAGQTFVPGEAPGQDEGCENLDCADGDPCTVDSCLSGECFHHQIQCDDGDPCTGEMGKDFCDPETGECQYPLWWDCDDGNECTFDLCDGVGGCSHTGHFGFCDDGDPCTLEDQCSDSVCVSGTFNLCDEACIGGPVEDCSDGDSCTLDYCDPALGCINEVMDRCP